MVIGTKRDSTKVKQNKEESKNDVGRTAQGDGRQDQGNAER